MIKNIFFVRVAAAEEQVAAWQRFFTELGLDQAEPWTGSHNRGTVFRTPQAAIEIGAGRDFPQADLACEVADADSAYEVLKGRGFKVLEPPADQNFGGRLFLVEPVPGQQVAVFSYLPEKQPQPIRICEGGLSAKGLRFGLVVSRFNSFITERLLQGAVDALRRCGAQDRDLMVARVPGSFEIPAAARTLAESGQVDAVVCLGCVIRGETTHYEHIATEVTRGIGQSAQETGVPHGYGLLSCENLEQAIDRAGLKAGNKGFEAAMAAVEMANLKKSVTSGHRDIG